MDPNFKLTLPFLTRDMLAFEHATAFAVRIRTQSDIAQTVFIRGFTREGPFEYAHTPTNDRAVTTEVFRLPDIPIFISVVDDTGGLEQGQIFAELAMTINGEVVYSLCSGFVYSNKAISWPTSTVVDTRPGGGQIKTVSSANPAAGSEISLSVPTGAIWRIIGCSFTLVTDANAANRRVHLRFDSAGGTRLEFFGDQDQTATLTRHYSAAPIAGAIDTLDNTEIMLPIPPGLLLDAGSSISTVTTAIQATDNFGAMDVWVEEFYTTA